MFEKHQQRWFINNVGKIVFLEPSRFTPATVRQAMKNLVKIDSSDHARALYNYHKDNKVNFYIPDNSETLQQYAK